MGRLSFHIAKSNRRRTFFVLNGSAQLGRDSDSTCPLRLSEERKKGDPRAAPFAPRGGIYPPARSPSARPYCWHACIPSSVTTTFSSSLKGPRSAMFI
jgi:hypothetical protein